MPTYAQAITLSTESGISGFPTSDAGQGPLTGRGVRWDTVELRASTTFKCTGSAARSLKTAGLPDPALILLRVIQPADERSHATAPKSERAAWARAVADYLFNQLAQGPSMSSYAPCPHARHSAPPVCGDHLTGPGSAFSQAQACPSADVTS